jgi:hypothetical protein
VQTGEKGPFLKNDKMNKLSDANKGGSAKPNKPKSKGGFKRILSKRKPVKMKLREGITESDAKTVPETADAGKEHMAKRDSAYTPTPAISPGDDDHASYAPENEGRSSDFNQDAAAEKATQSKHSGIGHTDIETRTRHHTRRITRKKPYSRDYSYDPNFEPGDEDKIHKDHSDYQDGEINEDKLKTIIKNTANNNPAIANSLYDLTKSLGTNLASSLITQSLSNLGNNRNPTGPQIRKALIKADQQLNYGTNEHTIISVFSKYGI